MSQVVISRNQIHDLVEKLKQTDEEVVGVGSDSSLPKMSKNYIFMGRITVQREINEKMVEYLAYGLLDKETGILFKAGFKRLSKTNIKHMVFGQELNGSMLGEVVVKVRPYSETGVAPLEDTDSVQIMMNGVPATAQQIATLQTYSYEQIDEIIKKAASVPEAVAETVGG